MGPTRKRDLTAAVVGAAAVGYLLVAVLYRWFPPITVWTGLSLLAVAVAEALWARYVRVKISDGEIGDGCRVVREISRLNCERAGDTGRLEYCRGDWNSWCSGEMRRYQEEHRWRRQVSGQLLTLRSESMGSEQD